MLLRRYGGTIQPLDMMGHYRDLVGFWSPSASPLLDEREPDWHRTIQDIAQFSEVCHRQAPDHGLCVDGYYYGVMVFKTTPRRTRQSTMDPFLNLAIPGLRVVLNAEPLSIETEMQYEESRFSKLMSNIDVENPSLESEIGLQKHRDRMARLMSNQTIPFKAQILVLACDRTTEGLDRKMEAVRAAIAKTGAEWHRPMVPTSVLAFYNCATPGIGPWVRYKDFRHKLDDINLANLLRPDRRRGRSSRKRTGSSTMMSMGFWEVDSLVALSSPRVCRRDYRCWQVGADAGAPASGAAISICRCDR